MGKLDARMFVTKLEPWISKDMTKQQHCYHKTNLTILIIVCFLFISLFHFSLFNELYGTISYHRSLVDQSSPRRNASANLNSSLTASKRVSHFYRSVVTKAEYPRTLTAQFLTTNSQICEGNVSVLIVVKTAGNHVKNRNRIRGSFGSPRLFRGNNQVRIAFMLGTFTDTQIMHALVLENALHHDIVQGDFIDSYKNLTLKGVLAYRWINNYCSHAQSVMFIDDDVYINIFLFLERFNPSEIQENNSILCNTMYPSPIIRYKSKWQVDHDFFRRQRYYPPYCSGFTVIMNPNIVFALWQAAHFTPVFWVDDVYLTGLLPSKYNISKESINSYMCLYSSLGIQNYNSTRPSFLSILAPKDERFYFYWDRSVKTLNPNMRHLLNETFLLESVEDRVTRLNHL